MGLRFFIIFWAMFWGAACYGNIIQASFGVVEGAENKLSPQDRQALEYLRKLRQVDTQPVELGPALLPPPPHSPWLKPLWLKKRLQQKLSVLEKARLLYQQYKTHPADKEVLQKAYEAFQQARQGLRFSSADAVVKPFKWSSVDEGYLQELKRQLKRKNKAYFVLQKPASALSLDEQFVLARHFVKKRQFSKARLIYDKITKNPKTPLHLKVKAYRQLARSYKLQQNRPAALGELLNLKNFLTATLSSQFYQTPQKSPALRDLSRRDLSPRDKSARGLREYFYVHRFYVNSLLSLVYAQWSAEKISDAQAHINEVLSQFQQHLIFKQKRIAIQKNTYKKYIKKGQSRWRKLKRWRTQKIDLNFLHQHFKLAQMYRLKGKINMQQGQFAKALEHYQKALRYKTSKTDRHQLLWDLAWAHKKQNNLIEAVRVLKNLAEGADRQSPLKRKYIFWQAYLQQQMGQTYKARVLFEQLLNSPVLSYYSVLAYEQLNRKGQVVAWPWALSRSQAKLSFAELSPAELSPAELSPLGASQKQASSLQLKFIEGVASQLPLLKILKQNFSKDVLWAYVKRAQKINKIDRVLLYSYLGQHRRALRAWANLGPRGKMQVEEKYLSVLFARPYEAEVQQATQQFQVPEALLYSIMRQESAFDTRARSPMDAFGLMQMLPEVAERTWQNVQQAQKSGGAENLVQQSAFNYQRAHDLYRPSVSIFLGAAHMGELLQQQGGNLIFSIASYNAGAQVVNKWKKFYQGPGFEFIEDIPYTETRLYTKLVLRNMAVYNYLRGSSSVITRVMASTVLPKLRSTQNPLQIKSLFNLWWFKKTNPFVSKPVLGTRSANLLPNIF